MEGPRHRVYHNVGRNTSDDPISDTGLDGVDEGHEQGAMGRRQKITPISHHKLTAKRMRAQLEG